MYKKFINGHTSCYGLYKYLLWDSETGNKRTIFSKTYNMYECYSDEFDEEMGRTPLPWWKHMDNERERHGTNTTPNGRRPITYMHYILSPNPIDNITPEQLSEFIDEWLERGFNTREDSGKFGVAVEMHNDNGLLHAHIIFNNYNYEKEWERSNRITGYLTPKVLRETHDLIQKMCFDRGWHNFLDKDIKDVVKAQECLDDENAKIEELSQKAIIIQEQQLEFFDDNKYVSNYLKYRRPIDIAPNGRIRSTRQGSYIDKKEAEILKTEGRSNKEDIRKCIDIAIGLSSNWKEFRRVMNCLNVEFSVNNRGDYVYIHPKEKNRRFTGYKLGSNYTKRGIERRLARNKPFNTNDKDGLKYYTGKIAGAGIVAVNSYDADLSLKDLARLVEINNKYNILNNNDYILKLRSLPENEEYARQELEWAMDKSEKVNQAKPPRSDQQRIDSIIMKKEIDELTDEEFNEEIKKICSEIELDNKANERKEHKKKTKKYTTANSRNRGKTRQISRSEQKSTKRKTR